MRTRTTRLYDPVERSRQYAFHLDKARFREQFVADASLSRRQLDEPICWRGHPD